MRTLRLFGRMDGAASAPVRVTIGGKNTRRAEEAGGSRNHGKRAAAGPRPRARIGTPLIALAILQVPRADLPESSRKAPTAGPAVQGSPSVAARETPRVEDLGARKGEW
jgi:hypothetical protein